MTFRPLSRWIGAALLLGLTLASPGRASDPPVLKFIPHPCAGAIDVPVRIVFDAPDGSIAPGATVTLNANVTADGPIQNVQIHFDTEGSVRLLGPPDLALGSLPQGLRAVEIPVQFTIPRALDTGRAAVGSPGTELEFAL